MGWISAFALAGAAAWLAKQMATFMVAGAATLIAAYYYRRRARLYANIDRVGAAARRRSLAKQLRLSIAMTAHFSLFPTFALRGYALAQTLGKFQ